MCYGDGRSVKIYLLAFGDLNFKITMSFEILKTKFQALDSLPLVKSKHLSPDLKNLEKKFEILRALSSKLDKNS